MQRKRKFLLKWLITRDDDDYRLYVYVVYAVDRSKTNENKYEK